MNLIEYTNHSGGAHGSDTAWDDIGFEFGMIRNNHYYAEGEKTPKGNVALSKSQLLEADQYLKEANKTLRRRFPSKNEYVNNLLRRNWWQVKNSDAIFAISTITNDKVDGGTGWAVHMGMAVGKPVYVFDQIKEKWYTHLPEIVGFMEMPDVPKLTKNFAGIGTREINEAGKNAIREVYKLTSNEIQIK